MKKLLIIGLGNPGVEYENTRHNIGFKTLDALASASNVIFKPNRYAQTTNLKIKGRNLILVKPSTFMNLSGKAVNYYIKNEKVKLENIIVLSDDIALPFGEIRIRTNGSHGGHNGLKHIFETIGHSKFNRLRFGVGNNFTKGGQVDYVLGKWSQDEEELLKERLDTLIEILYSFTLNGVTKTMNEFNGK
tara:strand:+ start:1919 stop:2485 length:567 start_codon:yes stop_codon:yes gene_type:complete